VLEKASCRQPHFYRGTGMIDSFLDHIFLAIQQKREKRRMSKNKLYVDLKDAAPSAAVIPGKTFLAYLAIIILGAGHCLGKEIPLCRIIDWTPLHGMVQKEGQTLHVVGRRTLFSEQLFPYESGRSYRIMGDFKAVPGSADNFMRIGIQPFDAEKNPLSYHFVNPLSGSDTVLLAEVREQDASILVEDASKWRVDKSDVFAFHTHPDGRDLPNRNIIRQAPVAIKQLDIGWQVTFAHPLGIALDKGVGVRMHRTGSAYYYAAYGSTIQGLHDPGWPQKFSEVGIRFFRIIIIANDQLLKSGQMRPVLEMNKVRLEIK
jgi:hypothetical protein